MEMNPQYKTLFGVGNILSSVQTWETSGVPGDPQCQRAVTNVYNGQHPSRPDCYMTCWCKIMPFSSICGHQETLARTYTNSYHPMPLWDSMVDLWTVWMSSATVQCYDRLQRRLKSSFSNWNKTNILVPAISFHINVQFLSSPCLGMSFNWSRACQEQQIQCTIYLHKHLHQWT